MALVARTRASRPCKGGFFRLNSQRRSITLSSYIVTPKELHDALKKNVQSKISTAPRVVPLSAAWFMPNDDRTGDESFKKKRIPNSRFFDLDDVKDHDSAFPHMLPTSEGFAQAMQKLGIKKDDEVVVYDTEELGIFSAPRVAWTLRVFGHPKVHLLNNFRLWVKQGLPVDAGEPELTSESTYPVPRIFPDMVVKFAEMKTIGYDYGKEGAEEVQILDARSKGRWEGSESEPRPGLRSGHMPGSTSLPFQDVLHPDTKAFLAPDELRNIFARKVDPQKPIITTCGTGVTAAVLEAALHHADFGPPEDRRVYDGSWTEWASRVSATSNLIRTERP